MPTENLNRIHGIVFEDIQSDQFLIRKAYIKNPYKQNGQWQFSINEKFLKDCQMKGLKKIILQIGERETDFVVPTQKDLDKMFEEKKYTWQPSIFKNGSPILLYKFILSI